MAMGVRKVEEPHRRIMPRWVATVLMPLNELRDSWAALERGIPTITGPAVSIITIITTITVPVEQQALL